MLLLNEITLFFYSRRHPPTKPSGVINKWVKDVTDSRSQSNSTSKSQSRISSALISVNSSKRSTSASATTAAKKSTSAKTGRARTPVNTEVIAVNNYFSGLDDEDEDVERDAALSSPIKGEARLTSNVHMYAFSFSLTVLMFAAGNREDRRQEGCAAC